MQKLERFFPAHQPEQLPDFEPLIRNAIQGQEDALAAIDGYLRPRFLRYFLRHIRAEADDLTEDTMSAILTNLPQFRLKSEGVYSQQFIYWCLRIGKSRLNMELARQYKQRREVVFIPEEIAAFDQFVSTIGMQTEGVDQTSEREREAEEKETEDEVLRRKFKEKLTEILRPNLRMVVELALDGKTYKEIASTLGYKERTVICFSSLARLKIEEQLLLPAGYQRIVRFGQAVKRAAQRGKISNAVQLLGMWYTTEEAVESFQQTKQVPDQDLISQGYVLLTETTSNAESKAIRSRYQHLIRIRRGRMYIRIEDLDQWRQTRKIRQASTPTFPSPGPEYKPLSAFVTTVREYNRLKDAAIHARLQTIKQGRWWFTTEEMVREFQETRNRKAPTPELNS